MSGRIRTIKPEWLEDETLGRAGDVARVLSVALILMADDHGRGRAAEEYVASQAWPYAHSESLAKAREGLASLSAMGFIKLYMVGGQRYFAIVNWSKHQRVDKPSKPRIPSPPEEEPESFHVTRDGVATIRETLANIPETLAPDPDPIPRPRPRPGGLAEPPDSAPAASGSSPSLSEQIREAEKRYPDGLATAAREACALSRKTGALADGVWLRTLKRLNGLSEGIAIAAMQVFVDRYADGDKSEAYLVAIAKNMAKNPQRVMQLPRDNIATIPVRPADPILRELADIREKLEQAITRGDFDAQSALYKRRHELIDQQQRQKRARSA